MKFIKVFLLLPALLIFGSAVAADPVLSIHGGGAGDGKKVSAASKSQNNVQVDFVEGDTPVVGLQFDLSLGEKVEATESSISSCGGRLPSGHQIICSVTSNGNVRVIVFSGSNAVIRTGTIATISTRGKGSVSFVKDSVQLGDAEANPVRTEIL